MLFAPSCFMPRSCKHGASYKQYPSCSMGHIWFRLLPANVWETKPEEALLEGSP